jgi:hypothetical protein
LLRVFSHITFTVSKNHNIVEESAYRVAEMQTEAPDDSSPNADAEPNLIATFADSTKVISWPEVILVDVEHTPTSKICFVSSRKVVFKTTDPYCV